jgi:signal transduction histidine kinase
MRAFHKIKKSNTLRWFFLGLGILAVVALTVLNIYSLYALQESTVEAAKENRKIQLEEFSQKVRFRFYQPFRGIRNLDMTEIELSWNTYGAFPEHFNSVLNEAINDSLFSDIFYTPDHMKGCFQPDYPLYKFDPESELFSMTNNSPKEVCDGFGLSKSRMNTVDLENYNWNNRTIFDSHRTMTLALINPDQDSVLGHVTFIINQDYLLNGVLKPMLAEDFGNSTEAGMVVWIRNWMLGDILLTNNSEAAYNRDNVDIYQRFPDLLDNWIIQASFLKSPVVSATSASLNRNLLVLGSAVLILFGALVFMFINAQKEREFAERQAGFLANVTHELKTPLALMQAAGENISDGRVSEGERLKNYGAHIYSESIRLRKMIDKLLDVAKSDSNQTMAKQAPLQLNELVDDFIGSKREYIENLGFRLRVDTQTKLPPVMVDRDHFETILGNLVENSVKYSWDKKDILVRVYSEHKSVYLSVADKGQGIPKKAQKNIFKKFYRVENSMTAQTKGHGLGLSIVRNMVHLNGGTISVKSEPEKGSEFTVTFHALFNQQTNENVVQKTDDSKNIAEVTLETYG